MDRDFTPATLRVFAEAARWSADPAAENLEAPSILLGLLAEEECRAAAFLTQVGLDVQAVMHQWPELAPRPAPLEPCGDPPAYRLGPEVADALALAEEHLADCPQPLALATEHVLLGMTLADDAAARFLRGRGLDPADLEAEIHRQYGLAPGALPVEPVDDPPPWEPASCGESTTIPPEAASPPAAPAGKEAPLLPIGTLRLLDAAADRAGEGLRVVEDFARFAIDDRHLTAECKAVRHGLAGLLAAVPMADRLAARETLADVGTAFSVPQETAREDLQAVLAANFARLQEALRSLEETAKTFDPAAAAGLEGLRYRTYTLQRALSITQESLARLRGARLYVLLDARASGDEFDRLVAALVQAGVDLIQLREKRLADRELLDRARRLRALTAGTGTLFIMNDRPDLAVLAHADGVHVGQEELTVKDARAIVGPRMPIGVSTHSLRQARQAVLDGAAYIGVGPTFPSNTKRFAELPGLDLLRAVANEIRLPAFAIGGIHSRNLDRVLSTGMTRVAVSGAVVSAADPAAAVSELQASLRRRSTHGEPHEKF